MIGDNNVDDLIDIIISTCRVEATDFWADNSDSPEHQAKNGFERFLQDLEFSNVRTLEDVVKFNNDHADVEFDQGRWCLTYLTAF